LSQVKRQGLHKAMAALEQVEPDLAGYLMEELSLVHQKLFHLGAAPKRTRWLVCRTEALVLVCVDALRRAHGELWTSLSELPAEPADRGRAPNPRARTMPPIQRTQWRMMRRTTRQLERGFRRGTRRAAGMPRAWSHRQPFL
jgi:hypothetical protein